MKKGLTTYSAISEVEYEINIDISLLDSRVFTTRDLKEVDSYNTRKEKGKKYLCVSIEVDLQDFESIIDAAAYTRPRLLIILGVMTFLTQKLFVSFEFSSTSSFVGSLDRGKNNKFNVDKINYLPRFKEVTRFLNSSNEGNKRLFYSLIDRYRKALYLEYESENSMVYDDEILLSYFHILELLSEEYYEEQKKTTRLLLEKFARQILDETFFFEKTKLEEDLVAKIRLAEDVFVSQIPVGSKIMFMLKKHGLLQNRLKSYIANLVKNRNSVAHGRQVYQDKIIFPVPPFFPLVRNNDYSVEVLRVLCGRVISAHLGMSHLKREWKELSQILMPSFDELMLFIDSKKYLNISKNEFYNGMVDGISPWVISYYLLNKKIKIDKAFPVLERLVLEYESEEEETIQLITFVILAVDKLDGELKNKAIEIIKTASKNRWLPDIKARDYLYYIEYMGHKPKLFREMLSRGEIS